MLKLKEIDMGISKNEVQLRIGDNSILKKLLHLEKRKRGVSIDKLLFLGMANIAEYYWCAFKSFYKSISNEMMFFSSYLHDRLQYSIDLGHIKNLPKKDADLLSIGDQISWKDIETLLKKREVQEKFESVMDAVESKDQNGNPIFIINPDLSKSEIEHWEKYAANKRIKCVSVDDYPLLRGNFLEDTRAEKYPSIRWNFPWNEYVLIGVPDGITDDIVYEFKTSRSNYLMYFLKSVATTQADLYGYFFKRGIKRVQIYVTEEKKMNTWEEPIDLQRANGTLVRFFSLEKGEIPIKPKEWKCYKCEYSERCKSGLVSRNEK